MQFEGLPNTDKIRDGEYFDNADECITVLKKGLVATDAGDNGAINVWKDHDGKYRMERMVHNGVVDSQLCTTYKDVRVWIKQAKALIE